MSDMKSALALFRQVESTGTMILQGYNTLQTVREAIQVAIHQAGYGVIFDPKSDPELVDYLTVAGTSGLDGALKGAFLGMLVGLLFERPGLGAAIGAGIGGGTGVIQGIQRVDQGWRIRALRAPDHTPTITIEAIRAA